MTEGQRERVAAALRGVTPDDVRTAQAAEIALVREGEAIVPAIREALATAEGARRDALDGALVRLTWRRDAREAVMQWLVPATHLDGAYWRTTHYPVVISDAVVTRTLPDVRFYTVHFRLFPVAFASPPPLMHQNLFAVSRAGVVTHLTRPEELQALFKARATVGANAGAPALQDVVYAWLRCSQEFSWDGFFQFTIPRDGIATASTGDARTATGDAIVTPKGGDRGKIHVAMTFDQGGRIAAIEETRSVLQGARPHCQATRLLDADPLVRTMAEEALLVIGVSARDYLAERRAEAKPELQRAIDRIWARIVERERTVGGTVPRLDLRTGP